MHLSSNTAITDVISKNCRLIIDDNVWGTCRRPLPLLLQDTRRPVHKQLRPSCTPKRASCHTVMSHSNYVTPLTYVYTKASPSLPPNQTISAEINSLWHWRTIQETNVCVLVQSLHVCTATMTLRHGTVGGPQCSRLKVPY